jgi:hypothetical protein
VELEWRWSGVERNVCGGGVEVEVYFEILGTLLESHISVKLFFEKKRLH